MNMAIRWTICTSLCILSLYRFAASAQADTRLEVGFVTNPVPTNSDAVLRCRVWEVGPTDNVGISRYNNNGMNTILYRNGAVLEDISDHMSLSILRNHSDGATEYTVTITGVDGVLDGGIYSCFVLTIDGAVQVIAAAKLEVTPPTYPICTVTPSDVGEGFFARSDIVLTCSSDRPSISDVQWVQEDDIPMRGQTSVSNGETVETTLTKTLKASDNGTTFRCILISQDPSKNGSECFIGPITVLKSNSTNEITRIAGLPLTVFIIVVVLGVIAFIVFFILTICCVRCLCGERSSGISHASSKSYSMHGHGSTGDSTLDREGTLPGGREVYHPARPAPPPPVMQTSSDNDSEETRPMSGIELALLTAITSSLGRKKTAKKPLREVAANEAIYANTTLGVISEENHSGHVGGVVNPSYEHHNEQTASTTRHPDTDSYDAAVYGNLQDLATSASSHHNEDYYSTTPAQTLQPVPLPKPAPKPAPKPTPKPTVQSLAGPTSNAADQFQPTPPVPLPKPITNSPTVMPVLPMPKPAIQTPPKPVLKPVASKPPVPTPVPLPIPAVNTPPKPSPKPHHVNNDMPSKPLPKPPGMTPARPSPPPKPATPSAPARPAPPPKPSYEITGDADPPAAAQPRPAPPPKPINNRLNDATPSAGRPPPPPPKPSYDITEERTAPPPAPPPKPTYHI